MKELQKEELKLERIEELNKEKEDLERKISEFFKETREKKLSEQEEWLLYKENVTPITDRVKYIEELIKRIERYNVEVGDGVTVCLYSDRHAGTIIKRTAKTITVQRDKAIKDENFKPEWDGFYCLNNDEQEYKYERNPQGTIEVFRWSDKYGSYRGGGDQSIRIINGRHEFYDYNF